MSRKRLKILITVLLALTLILLAIPFSRYFGIATRSQQLQSVEIQEEIPREIAQPEAIDAPRVQDVLEGAGNKNVSAVGQIVIPSVSISQPIFVGLTRTNMAEGTVSLFPNREPKNQTLTVIGHHLQYDSSLLFGGVQNLKKGADVYVRYLKDYYGYKVESNRIIKETDLGQLQDKGPNYLLLVTCNSASRTPYRVLVTAKKVEHSGAPQVMREAFIQKRQSVQKEHDQTYWVKFIIPLLVVLLVCLVFLGMVWKM